MGTEMRVGRAIMATLLIQSAVVGLVVVTSTSQAGPTRDPWTFWGPIDGYLGVEAEHYRDFGRMRDAADAVVLGRITDVKQGRAWLAEKGPTEDFDRRVVYANVEVEVERILHGELLGDSKSLVIEFAIQNERRLPLLRDAIPAQRGVFFLREKGAEAQGLGFLGDDVKAEIGRYRLVNGAGVAHDNGTEVWVRPDRDEPGIQAWAGRPFKDLLTDLAGG